MMASYYGFKCSNDISIISYLNVNLENFYMKLDKIHLFVEMKNQEGTFIVRNENEQTNKLINLKKRKEIIFVFIFKDDNIEKQRGDNESKAYKLV